MDIIGVLFIVCVTIVILLAVVGKNPTKSTNIKSGNYFVDNNLIEIVKFRTDEIDYHNHNLENSPTPEVLQSSKSLIIAHLEWFAGIEENNPNAKWFIEDAKTMIKMTRNRYNTMIYKMAKELFDEYCVKMQEFATDDLRVEHSSALFLWIDELRGFVDVKAENNQECFASLSLLYSETEDVFSVI